MTMAGALPCPQREWPALHGDHASLLAPPRTPPGLCGWGGGICTTGRERASVLGFSRVCRSWGGLQLLPLEVPSCSALRGQEACQKALTAGRSRLPSSWHGLRIHPDCWFQGLPVLACRGPGVLAAEGSVGDGGRSEARAAGWLGPNDWHCSLHPVGTGEPRRVLCSRQTPGFCAAGGRLLVGTEHPLGSLHVSPSRGRARGALAPRKTPPLPAPILHANGVEGVHVGTRETQLCKTAEETGAPHPGRCGLGDSRWWQHAARCAWGARQ